MIEVNGCRAPCLTKPSVTPRLFIDGWLSKSIFVSSLPGNMTVDVGDGYCVALSNAVRCK